MWSSTRSSTAIPGVGSVQEKIYEEGELHEDVDKLLLSSSDDEDCTEFTKNIDFKNKIRRWAIEKNITQTSLKDLLVILNDRFDNILPYDPRTILHTLRQVCIKVITGGEYWHNGIVGPLTKILNNWSSTPDRIHLNINLDGLPIFNSSKKEFWPILANTFEGNSTPFIIGVFYGTGKPKNLDEYLEDFVTETRQLLENGVNINGKNVSIKIRCFVCDSPARAFIKGVCNFNGKHGCLKCTTVGEYSHSSHTVYFSAKKYPQRTNENFRARKYGLHHKADSPFLKLPIDMVEDFPVADSLHLIDLGIMKRLLVGWRDGNFGKFLTKLCARDIEKINTFLKNCKQPKEIHRAVRTLDYLAHWKASEFRTFLHYLSIVILPSVLKRDVFEHFLSLFCGITICSTQGYFVFLPLAREMLANFVERYKYFYGTHYITSNVHNLLHVVDEVERFGPLQTFNAYPFENKLYLIKNMLRQGNSPLSQIAKRLSEDNLEKVPIKSKAHNFVPFLTINKNVSILHFEEFILSSRPADRYFLTQTNEVFELKDIIVSNDNEISIYGHTITNKTDVFVTPIRSSYLNMYKTEDPYIISPDVTLLTKDVKLKLFCVSYKNILHFVPLLHTV